MPTIESRTVPVASCATREEAEFLKELLESRGVKAMIEADEYWGITLMTTGGVHVLVLDESLEYAREILQQAQDPPAAPAQRPHRQAES